MKISHKQNLLYKDRMSHKQKPFVTKEQFSNKSFNETPLERESNDISFKGVSSYLYKESKAFNLPLSIKTVEKYIGKSLKRLNNNVDKWGEIQEFIIKNDDKTKVVIKEKSWVKHLINGIAYPFLELPLHIGTSIKNIFVKKVPKEAKEAKNLLEKHVKILNNTDIINSFSGYLETVQKYKYDTEKVKSAGFFTNAMKMSDPKSGNYNAVHERALTRVVTGFIPAFFLANDAYNLSRICDDDQKAAAKEKKARFNQETKRVLSNAYIQLITLGALSKYINRSKAMFIGVTAASVLLTESFSRLTNNKKLYFVNKEEALKMNEKAAAKKDIKVVNAEEHKTEKAIEQKPAEAVSKSRPGFKGSKVFNNFGLISDMPWNSSNINMTGKKPDRQEIKELKPLITLPTIVKWFVGTIAAGFAIKYGKKAVLKNGNKIGDYFNVISKRYDKFYNNLTMKDYTVTKEEFGKVLNKLREYDDVLAQKFEDVVAKSQKSNKVSKIANELASELENSGLKDFAKEFKHIANEKLENTFSNIGLKNNAEKYFKGRNKKIIENNVRELISQIKRDGLFDEAKNLEEILFDNKNQIDLNKLTKARKMLQKEAKRYIENNAKENKETIKEAGENLLSAAFSLENRFKVDKADENLKLFEKAINELKQHKPELAARFENTVNEAAKNDVLSLGKKNKPVIKQVADFVTEPFKFLWGTVTLPYKHVANKIAKLFEPAKLPEWENELQAVANGVTQLTQKPKFNLKAKPKIELPKEQFQEFMDKQINKAFNTASMSSISNSDLSALAKNTSVAATAWFLMADNYNMVMQKTNGEGKKDAAQKAKERAIQETSRSFYSVLFINLFNNTFRSLYNNSLFGAQTVNTASTLIGEYVNRKSIGMPVGERSRDEIINKEYENITSKGPKGKFFRFMSRLTGKKVLSQRDNVKKEQAPEKK